jgi:hypothetical protein
VQVVTNAMIQERINRIRFVESKAGNFAIYIIRFLEYGDKMMTEASLSLALFGLAQCLLHLDCQIRPSTATLTIY